MIADIQETREDVMDVGGEGLAGLTHAAAAMTHAAGGMAHGMAHGASEIAASTSKMTKSLSKSFSMNRKEPGPGPVTEAVEGSEQATTVGTVQPAPACSTHTTLGSGEGGGAMPCI